MHHTEHCWFTILDVFLSQMLQLQQQQMRENCSADVMLVIVQQGQQQHKCNSYQSCAVVGGQYGQPLDINNMTRDGAEIGYCGSRCNTRTHSSLRGSVSFCSIECFLATKICGEARIHEISKTQKQFVKIPPRSVSIRLLIVF